MEQSAASGANPAYHVRYRGAYSLLLARPTVTIYLQGEPWQRLAEHPSWNRYRLTAGVQYRAVDCFLRYQGDQGEQADWVGTVILGLRLKSNL